MAIQGGPERGSPISSRSTISDLRPSKPSYSGLHLPWECPVGSPSPRYVMSQSTGQGHTRVRPTMSCGNGIRKYQSSPCPKFRDIITARIHALYPLDFLAPRFLCIIPPPSYSSQNPSQILSSRPSYQQQEKEISVHFPKCLAPSHGTAKVTFRQQFCGVRCLPLILELLELDYESPDDDELSDDTISDEKRPIRTDFNRTVFKSKVIDWRDDPRIRACQQICGVAPSEQSGDSFASQDHHYADGVERGSWMLGNPNNARANAYYH